MRQTIRTLVGKDGRVGWLIPVVVAVLLIALNGVLALAYLHDIRNANLRADRSLQAMLLLKNTEDMVEARGSGQRTYRLSGDAQHLAAYQAAQQALPSLLARLRDLIADDAGQLRRFADLANQIEQDGTELAADLASAGARFSDGRLPSALDAGLDRTAAIVAAVDAMLLEQQTLLRAHLAAGEARAATALTVGLFVRSGAILMVVAIVVWMARRAGRSAALAAAQSHALQDSELRFRRVFEESPLGILLAEPGGLRIVQANPAFCRMLGSDPAQVVGRPIADLMHIDDRGVLSDALVRRSGPDIDVAARFITHTGTIAWTSVHLVQLSASEGRTGLMLALTKDVTRENRVEGELRQAQKMEAIGQLSGGIAHDFNNLLGVIIGNVEFLIDSPLGPGQADLAKEILDSALSGADLTRRLLAFARRQTLQPRQIDLNAYLPNHIAILRRLLGESTEITVALADGLWPTRADPSQVGDALLNMAINARDAMPHGGRLTISTENAHLAPCEQDSEVTPGDYVMLSVTDTGIGMSPEVLERVVEPFFSTKRPGAGSGLGLSMIFGFAMQSGGHLRIDSQVGRGTTVRLYLPRTHAAEAEDSGETANLPLPQGTESILLVDDNAEMRAVARRHLVSLGYRVSEAASGPAALQVLQDDDNIDLLFTDVVMPGGMTGYQLAAAARQIRPLLKVVFTTGYFRPEPGSEAAAAAAGAMIRKPYRRQELAETVRAALET